jgi:FkbM family methyltransferase
MPHHENEYELREKELKGITDKHWIWPKKDKGGWEGPTENWNESHHVEYFKFLNKYDVVVTAGANCGLHVRGYAEKFKAVYAFEPDYKNFYCMTRNCLYPNVFKFNAALHKEAAFCSMNKNESNWGAFTVNMKDCPEKLIPMMSIDSLNLWACDLIQLDVEGWEDDVIRGAMVTIEKFKPVIITERNSQTMQQMLSPFGYNGCHRSKMDTIHVIEDLHKVK